MAESGYGLAGLGRGKVKSINQYRLTPGFGGFTLVPYVTTECRLPCRWRGIKKSLFSSAPSEPRVCFHLLMKFAVCAIFLFWCILSFWRL
ncbi:hypothetical protein EQJ94_23900 [Escherichia coli]|nr:hypothetical protein [Escherichia coli]EFC0397157.1 hypothetical protein [Escherichia coli]EFE4913209.1 hypothetical protein [Escherichia coli]MHO69139.1 hypothetical protein [Escherichia coli]